MENSNFILLIVQIFTLCLMLAIPVFVTVKILGGLTKSVKKTFTSLRN